MISDRLYNMLDNRARKSFIVNRNTQTDLGVISMIMHASMNDGCGCDFCRDTRRENKEIYESIIKVLRNA